MKTKPKKKAETKYRINASPDDVVKALFAKPKKEAKRKVQVKDK